MRSSLIAGSSLLLLGAPSRPADLAFRITMGYGETVAVADINHDGKLDIVAGESWPGAPMEETRPAAD